MGKIYCSLYRIAVGGAEVKDEYMVRYTNKRGLGCTLVVYATTMFEAKEKAEKELGDYLKSINEIVNCSFARKFIRSQDFE
ncbi:hypothetical protein DTPHA_1406519 [Enterococcus faecium]|nr:hypothetical protein DTPHA_1406519 [Enterococcus faecium]